MMKVENTADRFNWSETAYFCSAIE